MGFANARATAVAVVCTFSVLVAGPGAAASASTAGGEGSSSASSLNIGTYNIRAGVTVEAFRGAVTALVPYADVIGLQEVNSKSKQAVLAEVPGWDFFRPPRFYGEQKPIMWNEAVFSEVSSRSVEIGPEADIGNEVPGKDGYIKPQYASVTRLLHRASGQPISIVNLHLVPGAVKAGRKWPGRTNLFRYYTRELAVALQVVTAEAAWGEVFVLGDYNAGWVADERNRKPRLPFMRFRGLGMRSMWETERPAARVGTHRDALIDQVFTDRPAARAGVLSHITFSDHVPAVATYELPALGS